MKTAELLGAPRRAGWVTSMNGGNHWVLSHPEATRPVPIPNTPSDYRNAANPDFSQQVADGA